jgi:hypothetical protein
MAIIASNKGGGSSNYAPIPAGNYIARCYQMIELGTTRETILGNEKDLHKIRLTFELPTEVKVFNEEKGEQPLVISKEFTLSMNEKASLRIFLKSWRGKDFTEEEAKCFDVTKLLGAPCMLNIIHKPSKKDPSVIYAVIGSCSPVPKGLKVDKQINETFVLSYDEFSWDKFNTLPDFIRTKMQNSMEYAALTQPNHTDTTAESLSEPLDDLPF